MRIVKLSCAELAMVTLGKKAWLTSILVGIKLRYLYRLFSCYVWLSQANAHCCFCLGLFVDLVSLRRCIEVFVRDEAIVRVKNILQLLFRGANQLQILVRPSSHQLLRFRKFIQIFVSIVACWLHIFFNHLGYLVRGFCSRRVVPIEPVSTWKYSFAILVDDHRVLPFWGIPRLVLRRSLVPTLVSCGAKLSFMAW